MSGYRFKQNPKLTAFTGRIGSRMVFKYGFKVGDACYITWEPSLVEGEIWVPPESRPGAPVMRISSFEKTIGFPPKPTTPSSGLDFEDPQNWENNVPEHLHGTIPGWVESISTDLTSCRSAII